MQTTRPAKHRIIACRGSIQLAAAIAAMRTMRGGSLAPADEVNHLIIHDLSTPEAQGEEFADSIRGLAEQVETWGSIHYLSRSFLGPFQKEAATATDGGRAVLAERLGIDRCDELYVGQNDKFPTIWLRKAFPEARQICYGDGLALNFTEAYYRPKEAAAVNRRPTPRLVWRKVRTAIKRFFAQTASPPGSPSSGKLPELDTYCLLLANLFDQKVNRVAYIDRQIFVDLFAQFAETFALKAPATHSELVRLTNRPGRNSILLTSNFSETERMSLEGEIDGYWQLLRQMPMGADVTLFIKPHPRDSYEKIDLLRQRVAGSYAHVLPLTDPWTFYLPFESLYARYFAAGDRPTSVATVSSACLSLEYLYGQQCQLGFGPEIVDREFVPAWRPLRTVHEDDLRKIVAKLRRKVGPGPRRQIAAA